MHTYLALFPLDIYSKANVYLNCFVDSFNVFTACIYTPSKESDKCLDKTQDVAQNSCDSFITMLLLPRTRVTEQNSEEQRWDGEF